MGIASHLHHETPVRRPRTTGRTAQAPARDAPRFPGDWVEARLRLCPDSARAHVATSNLDWILPVADFGALRTALAGAPEAVVQFNPDASLVLVPGAHELLGSSFFKLHA